MSRGFVALMIALSACFSPVRTVHAAEPISPLADRVKDLLRSRCSECHGGTSSQAGIDVLSWKNLVDGKHIVAGQPDQSPLYLAVINPDEDVRMPQDLPPLPQEDIDLIRGWIVDGAVKFSDDVQQPVDSTMSHEHQGVVGISYVLGQIHEHQRKLTSEQKRYVRYFSSHHLLAAGVTRQTLDLHRMAFAIAINHLSYEPELVVPEVINPEVGTILAVDIRQLGWNKPAMKSVGSEQAKVLNLYDLVLLEYPYAVAYEDSATYDALATEYMKPAGLIRPIPFVRIDWFCSVATLPPLYHDLLQLPRNLLALEKQLGIDTAVNLEDVRARRAGMTVSGVSRNNRAVERHPYRHGAYWKSIDYASSKGHENIFTDPIHLLGTGGEMIFNLPNGLHAYYVSDALGGRLDDAPTSIVTDRFAEDKTVRNGLSCIRCHDRGIKDFRDDVRPAVEKVAGSGVLKKKDVLALYPDLDTMENLVKQDRERFLMSYERLLGGPQQLQPIVPVSQRFLDAPLQLGTVAGELGLTSADELPTIFRQPQFTGFGLVALGNAGVIRRDMWEDYFDQVVRALGLGIPVLPIDGLTRPDYRPQGSSLDVVLGTSKKNNVFSPGEELSVQVSNRGKSAIFIELVGTGTRGEKVILVPAGTKVEAGQTFQFPPNGTIVVQAALGKELITLFASETQFASGQIFRGEHIDDRIVHDFYRLDSLNAGHAILHDARQVLKRTIQIETR